MSKRKTYSSDTSSSTDHRSLLTNDRIIGRSKTEFLDLEPGANRMSQQEHGRTRNRYVDVSRTPDSSNSISRTSLSSSIANFRCDFEDLKCKMRIFGESLNLCRCIADDFKNKLSRMEKRLQHLEKRQKNYKSETNYSTIIKKNKRLSHRTLCEAKKLQMCGTEEEMREVAARICRNYLHGAWKSVEPTDLDFKRISGGLSNFLYYVALPEDVSKLKSQSECYHDEDYSGKSLLRSCSFAADEPRKVLLRIYGQVHGERAMDAIVTESVIFTLLSERRLGPKLHGVFSGGRIEEYIPARPLLTKELAEPALSMKIAEKMAAIHSMDVPLSKEASWLWKTLYKWNKTVKEERLSGTVQGKNEDEAKIIKRLKTVDFDKEIEWLKKFIATVDSPVVFCHNDMQEGNILMLEDIPTADDDPTEEYSRPYRDSDSMPRSNRPSFEPLSQYDESNTIDSILSSHISDTGEPRLVLIDFEYCAYNYRGFDIANHFQEWSYDYTNPEHPNYYENQENSPNLEQKEIFIREYLEHYQHNSSSKDSPPSIDDVNHLLHEVDAFALASHLFWCLWSVVNASKSQIPFGYWEYALSRLDTYFRLKQEVVKKDKFGSQKRKICEVDI